jgi:hypothetical protein
MAYNQNEINEYYSGQQKYVNKQGEIVPAPKPEYVEVDESENFEDDGIDEFEDYEEAEESRGILDGQSEKSFAEQHEYRMDELGRSTLTKRQIEAEAKHYSRQQRASTERKKRQYGAGYQDQEVEFVEGSNMKGMEEFDEMQQEEFEDSGEKRYIERKTQDGVEKVEIVVKKINEPGRVEEEGPKYSTKKTHLDVAHENRFLYQESEEKAFNTQIRAEIRDQIKQDKMHQESQEHEKMQQDNERHKEKTNKIAEKAYSRAFPYGTNYSEAKETEKFVNKIEQNIKFKPVTSEVLNHVIKDKKVLSELLQPEDKPKKKKITKSIDNRLYQKSNVKKMKYYDEHHNVEAERIL